MKLHIRVTVSQQQSKGCFLYSIHDSLGGSETESPSQSHEDAR